MGKQNNGSHFDLVLHQQDIPRLLTPGHTLLVKMNPEEKTLFKYSFPRRSSTNIKLFMEVEGIWGNFNLYVSKSPLPDEDNNRIKEQFFSTKSGLLNSLKSFDMQAVFGSDI